MMLPNFLAAQANFFTVKSLSDVTLSVENTQRHQKFLVENNGDVKIVSIGNFQESSSDTLNFTLPIGGTQIKVVGEMVSNDSELGFLWSGRIINQLGYVCLVKKDNLVGGFIQVGRDFFELSPIDANNQFLVKTNKNEAPSCGNTIVQNPVPVSTGPNTEPKCKFPVGYNTYNTCSALISVLLVITPEARVWIESRFGSALGVGLFATLGQLTANFAFYNSDIPNKEVRVKTVFANFPAGLSGNPLDDFDQLPNPTILGNLRTANNADIAFLIVKDKYIDDDAAGFVSGIGPNNSANAYGALEVAYFINDLAFVHEIGHIIGCRHNWSSTFGNDDTEICAHGKRSLPDPSNQTASNETFIYNSWRTIMGIGMQDYGLTWEFPVGNGFYKFIINSNDPRILHFSNPDVNYGAESTGTATGYIANNAIYIRNDACNISQYNPTQELGVFIKTGYCESVPYTLYADITTPSSGLTGQGPYQVRWYWNETAFFGTNPWTKFLGDGQTLSLTNHPTCPVYWVKCFVFAADGTWISRVKKIDLSKCGCAEKTGQRDLEVKSSYDLVEYSSKLMVQPNPSNNGFVLLSSNALKNTETSISISNIDGKLINKLTQQFDQDGTTVLNLNLDDGLYFISVKLPNGSIEITKLFILKN
jgi:Secretion system C-terminal sorting domain/Metallo-peptidase family M12B Reprolysin-like